MSEYSNSNSSDMLGSQEGLYDAKEQCRSEQTALKCAQCLLYKEECDRLKQELELANQQLVNMKHFVESQQQFCIETQEKQVDSEQKAHEASWILTRTKERFRRIELKHKLDSLAAFLKENRNEIIATESKVRNIRADPHSTTRYLQRVKNRLGTLREERKSMIATSQNIQQILHEQDELITASINNDIKKVEELVFRGVSVNLPDETGYTAFKYACGKSNNDVVELMLKHTEVDINYFDANSDPSILIAAKQKNDVILRRLLEHGADPNVQNTAGQVPLHEVCSSGRLNVATTLLKWGANVNLKDNKGNTALFYAATKNHVDLAILLLDQGSSIEIKNAEGLSIVEASQLSKASEVLNLIQRRAITSNTD